PQCRCSGRKDPRCGSRRISSSLLRGEKPAKRPGSAHGPQRKSLYVRTAGEQNYLRPGLGKTPVISSAEVRRGHLLLRGKTYRELPLFTDPNNLKIYPVNPG